MKNFILILTLFAGFLVWQSCEYDWIESEPVIIPDSVSFATDIMPLFKGSCDAGVCHGKGGKAPELTDENAYTSLTTGGFVDLGTPENSIIYTKMAPGGSMNKYLQSAGDPQLVLKWIQDGALDN